MASIWSRSCTHVALSVGEVVESTVGVDAERAGSVDGVDGDEAMVASGVAVVWLPPQAPLVIARARLDRSSARALGRAELSLMLVMMTPFAVHSDVAEATCRRGDHWFTPWIPRRISEVARKRCELGFVRLCRWTGAP
jgi:hypothetical protein